MATRNRVWNLCLIGPQAFQLQTTQKIFHSDSPGLAKFVKKILANPTNYSIGSMSEEDQTILQIVKTPNNVKYMRNILTGCLISDHLIFTLDCSSVDRLVQNLQEFCITQISKYFLK